MAPAAGFATMFEANVPATSPTMPNDLGGIQDELRRAAIHIERHVVRKNAVFIVLANVRIPQESICFRGIGILCRDRKQESKENANRQTTLRINTYPPCD